MLVCARAVEAAAGADKSAAADRPEADTLDMAPMGAAKTGREAGRPVCAGIVIAAEWVAPIAPREIWAAVATLPAGAALTRTTAQAREIADSKSRRASAAAMTRRATTIRL